MPSPKQRRARIFVVSALLGIPSDDAEYLAIVKNQITDIGTLVKDHDEELFNSMISFFESSTEKHKREEIQRFR